LLSARRRYTGTMSKQTAELLEAFEALAPDEKRIFTAEFLRRDVQSVHLENTPLVLVDYQVGTLKLIKNMSPDESPRTPSCWLSSQRNTARRSFSSQAKRIIFRVRSMAGGRSMSSGSLRLSRVFPSSWPEQSSDRTRTNGFPIEEIAMPKTINRRDALKLALAGGVGPRSRYR
jgi:hypothetical protein